MPVIYNACMHARRKQTTTTNDDDDEDEGERAIKLGLQVVAKISGYADAAQVFQKHM